MLPTFPNWGGYTCHSSHYQCLHVESLANMLPMSLWKELFSILCLSLIMCLSVIQCVSLCFNWMLKLPYFPSLHEATWETLWEKTSQIHFCKIWLTTQRLVRIIEVQKLPFKLDYRSTTEGTDRNNLKPRAKTQL